MKLDQVAMRRGQNTAEYLILLVLVAVGCIGMFGVFGDSLKRQVANAMYALEGNSTALDAAENSDTDPSTILDDNSRMGMQGREWNDTEE